MIPFNINHYVWVQLTDFGRHVLKQQAEEFRRRYPKVTTEFKLPVETAEGWSKWQLYNLMNTFGKYLHLGAVHQPFETEIRFDINGD